MKMIKDYVEEAKEQLKLPSYNALAKHLGWNPQSITKIKNGGSINDSNAERLAQLLHRDPMEIIATAHSQRAENNDVKAIWIKLAKEKGNK
jgi:ribosome-binding protein aMBF1 (putative translation factor)